MNLHAALVRFIQHKLQRIVAGYSPILPVSISDHGRISDRQSAVPSGFTRKDGIDPRALQVIEFSDQRQLLLRDAALRRAGDNRPDRRPVKARNGGEPHAAHRLPVRLPGFDGGSVRRRDKGFRGFTGAAEQHASGDERRACQRHFAG